MAEPVAELPSSVGFSITQMIDRGLLDDCLQLIKAHAAARQASIAKERIRKPPRPEGANARGPIPKRFGDPS